MNKILLGLFLLFSVASVRAQGIEFFHGTWSEAVEKAKADGRLIFVDAFASWCGPCKRMAKETFPDPKAGEYFNSNFLNLKIDMEKPENAEFAGKFPVSSYPTLLFIDPATQKVVMREIGAKDVDALIEVGKKAMGKNDKSGDFEKKYNEGDRDPKLVYDYVRALNAAGKPSLKVANEYFNSQKDLTTEFNLRFIFEAAVESDSRIFDLLLKYRDKIGALVTQEALNQRMESACKRTIKKAIEYKNETLLEEAKTDLAKGNPARAEVFGYEADMAYFKATKDVKKYLKAIDGYRKAEAKTAAKLHDLVIMILRAFPTDEKALDQAENWAKKAAEEGNTAEFYMTLAEVYKRQGNKEKSKKSAEKALELVGDKDSALKAKIGFFIDGLQS